MDHHDFDKLFSLREADALVPQLEAIMPELQAEAKALKGRIAELAASDPSVAAMRIDRIIEVYPELRASAIRISELGQQIEAFGCILKDITHGLVDFPAEINGTVAFLCWQYGERHVVAWHPIEGNFGDRQPLPIAVKSYLN